MKLKYENEILDAGFRKRIITEIIGSENQRRKDESYRRYIAYKDQINRFVVENLLRQFDLDTVVEMRYSIANISIVKKVIDKLARVYNAGVTREVEGDKEATENVQKAEKVLKVNTEMKRTNRYLKLQKNTALYIKPCPVFNEDGTEVKWRVKLEPLCPHHYDVLEDANDRTKPLVYILSDYNPVIQNFAGLDFGIRPLGATINPAGDGVDQTIANTPEDQGRANQGRKTYVWWSKHYHFTTDEHGEIISDPGNPDGKNPFGTCLIKNFAIDQDGAFWAEGGNDLIEGAVLINSMMTHLNNVGVTQSYGQFYMTGENLPRAIKMGPQRAIVAEYKKDDQAEPKMGFLNANPQLDSLRGCIEAYVALLLTTNNLSTSGVSAQLSGSKEVASGIALVIDKSESLEDVQEQRQIFVDEEPDIWGAIASILNVYRSLLVDELKEIKLPEDISQKFVIRFNDPSPIMSEKEKLEIYKLREELGLDSLVSLLMKDDPSLTEEQAEKKLMKLIQQRMEIMKQEQTLRAEMEVETETEDPNNPENPNAEDPKVDNEGNKDDDDGE